MSSGAPCHGRTVKSPATQESGLGIEGGEIILFCELWCFQRGDRVSTSGYDTVSTKKIFPTKTSLKLLFLEGNRTLLIELPRHILS